MVGNTEQKSTKRKTRWVVKSAVLYNYLIRVDSCSIHFQFNDIFNERTNERYLKKVIYNMLHILHTCMHLSADIPKLT